MTMVVDKQSVSANIRVKFTRITLTDGRTEWDQLRIDSVRAKSTDLTREEQDNIVGNIMETAIRVEIINALLDALAGKDTHL